MAKMDLNKMLEETLKEVLEEYGLSEDMSLKDCVEKQIPKKLLNYNKISAAGNCPGCMAFVDSQDAYCRRCGQRLEEEP